MMRLQIILRVIGSINEEKIIIVITFPIPFSIGIKLKTLHYIVL